MNRKIFKLFAVVLAVFMVTGSAVTVFADTGTSYSTTIDGTKTTEFDKYLVMDENASVPNVTFEYTISAGSAHTYDTTTGKFEVKSGVMDEAPTITWDSYKGKGAGEEGADAADAVKSTVEFKVSDSTISYDANKASSGGADDPVKNLEVGKKYAKHTATVDFTNVKFTEPGIYRYVITETASTSLGITNDEKLTRYLDVYVEDATNGTTKQLEIKTYILHDSDNDIVPSEDGNYTYSDNKNQGFTNTYDTYDLTFSKTVSGTQASRDKYFKFTVIISGAVKGTKYKVDISKADSTVRENAATDTTYVGQTNTTELEVGEDGTVTKVFYLQHGQEITIRGLAAGTKYSIEETNEDYKVSTSVVEGDAEAVTGTAAKVEDDSITGDTTVAYTNTRNGVIPTGVLLTIAPFVGLTAVGGIGLGIFMRKKKSSKEESED